MIPVDLRHLLTPLFIAFRTWPGTKVVPGGTLMSLAAAAAYETIDSVFSIDTLQAHFLSGSKDDVPLRMRVQRLSDGRNFITRVVHVEQNNTIMVHITCSFVRSTGMRGPSMTHSASRKTSQIIDAITLDDLGRGGNKQGPIMKFQRLPLVYTGGGAASSNPTPDTWTYTSAAVISTPIPPSDSRLQALGIISLSDYHILDAPPTLHRIPFGVFNINDATRTPTDQSFERFTSLNHTIRFHVHEGFRADEMCYIEVQNPWTGRRRAEVQSRIFDSHGKLVATCVQGSYYVLKEPKDGSKL